VNIARIAMKGNLSYSIPPSQLPFVIPPGSSQRLSVCVEGRNLGDQIDTMIVYDGCGHEEHLMMKTPVLASIGTGSDWCNNAISISTFAPSKRTFLTAPMPNPAHGEAVIDLGLTHPETVNLELLDAFGKPALAVLRGIDFPSGVSRVMFDISTLDAGAYFCRMTTATGMVYVEKMIVTR
jgi:hypothetical protein